MFKIEVEDDEGGWSDVRGADDAILTFENEDDARAKRAEEKSTALTSATRTTPAIQMCTLHRLNPHRRTAA